MTSSPFYLDVSGSSSHLNSMIGSDSSSNTVSSSATSTTATVSLLVDRLVQSKNFQPLAQYFQCLPEDCVEHITKHSATYGSEYFITPYEAARRAAYRNAVDLIDYFIQLDPAAVKGAVRGAVEAGNITLLSKLLERLLAVQNMTHLMFLSLLDWALEARRPVCVSYLLVHHKTIQHIQDYTALTCRAIKLDKVLGAILLEHHPVPLPESIMMAVIINDRDTLLSLLLEKGMNKQDILVQALLQHRFRLADKIDMNLPDNTMEIAQEVADQQILSYLRKRMLPPIITASKYKQPVSWDH